MARSPGIQMTVSVSAIAHRKLFEQAAARGYKPSAYAQMLFDAAFAARCGQERDEPPADAELDEQVRLVFACAGQGNSAAIARATGVPEHRVVRILDAWKQAGGLPKRAPVQAPAAAPAVASGGYPVETIRRLWAEGLSTREIADRIGKGEGALSVWMTKHRDVCPKRRRA
ncbi:MAG: helix-turn-helix domain-containing protein [Rhizobiaceae bacterium]|nr:helix-turn-helix domain-containing protein [Rhizobiaceae bacterium]